MTLAKQALALRRREMGARSMANHWASVGETTHPYWERNLRTYQNLMCRNGDKRAALLIAYVASRKAREH